MSVLELIDISNTLLIVILKFNKQNMIIAVRSSWKDQSLELLSVCIWMFIKCNVIPVTINFVCKLNTSTLSKCKGSGFLRQKVEIDEKRFYFCEDFFCFCWQGYLVPWFSENLFTDNSTHDVLFSGKIGNLIMWCTLPYEL